MADGRTTLLILALMQFGMGLMGYHSGAEMMANGWLVASGGTAGYDNIPLMMTILVGGILGAAGAGVVASYLNAGFGVIYLIPAAIMLLVIGMFLLPITFFTEPAIPILVKTLLGIVFGTMMTFTVLSFVRGGEV